LDLIEKYTAERRQGFVAAGIDEQRAKDRGIYVVFPQKEALILKGLDDAIGEQLKVCEQTLPPGAQHVVEGNVGYNGNSLVSTTAAGNVEDVLRRVIGSVSAVTEYLNGLPRGGPLVMMDAERLELLAFLASSGGSLLTMSRSNDKGGTSISVSIAPKPESVDGTTLYTVSVTQGK